MNNLENPQAVNADQQKLNALLEKFKNLELNLQHDTADQEQLSPYERMESIKNVWESVKDKLNNPQTALDVGSGFGYGTALLDNQGIKTIGIENVANKNQQAKEMFKKLGIDISSTEKIDFENSPAVWEGDFNELDEEKVADLITMFYLSGELVRQADTFETSAKLLKDGGQMLLATEADRDMVEKIISSGLVNIPDNLSIEIIDIEDNFEKTAILINKK